MTRGWMLGTAAAFVLLGLSAATVAWGRNGVVVTKDGNKFSGEITEKGNSVVVTPPGGKPVTLNKANVERIDNAASNEDEFRARLGKLAKDEVDGRIKLAQWALDRKEYSLSLDALDGAIAIDPNNEEARQLHRTVTKVRQLNARNAAAGKNQPGAVADGGRSGQRPEAAEPAEAAPEDAPAAEAQEQPAAGERGGKRAGGNRPGKLRMVTDAEVNRIRQLELQKGENTQIRFQKDVKRRYLASSEFTPQEFNQLSPQQQGFQIISNGSSKLHEDVIVAGDPRALAQFKANVHRYVLPGCATASCHGGTKGGDFTLHNPAGRDTEVYTNFLLLQGYKTMIDGKDYAMIDRARPENSLLLLFGMPQDSSPMPHPKAQNFQPMFKGRNDPRYKGILDWAGRTLAPVQPEYGIDLSEEPGTAGGSTTRPARQREQAREQMGEQSRAQ